MAGRALAKLTIPATKTIPLEEQIRQRAHEIYLQRGGQDGSEIDDWLLAEAEICQDQRTEPKTSDGA